MARQQKERGMGLGPIDCPGERKRFLAYDMEWFPHSYKIRLVGVFDGSRYRHYTTVHDFLAGELTSRNRGAVFFAHAGGLADVQFVFEAMLENRDPELTVDVSFSGSSAVIVRVKKGKNTWTFADSFWILKAPLRDIGRLLGMVKGGEEGGLSQFYAPLPELIEYNANDCRILYMAMRQFEDETLSLGGELRLTIASCAMYLFRAAFLKRTIPTHAAVNNLARKAYVASRVEVFATSCGPARSYDINSSFPYSMTYPLPGRLLCSNRTLEVPRKGGSPLYSGEPCTIADLTVYVPEGTYIPPLPVRDAERVYFPVGQWRNWFSSPDIETLQKVPGAKIIAVHEVLHFEPFTDMKDYIDILYAKRMVAKKEGNTFRAETLKFYLNTLYGKTAESRLKEALVIGAEGGTCNHSPPCELDVFGRLPCIRMLRPGVFLKTEEVPISHEWVPIAAHVTARSRLALFDLLIAAKDPKYCDTDCVVMPRECGELPTSPLLGDLKLDKEIDAAIFLAPKLYRMTPSLPTEEGIRKKMQEKGIERDAAVKALSKPMIRAKGFRPMTPEEFERLANGDPIDVARMLRVRETLSGVSPAPREHVYWKQLRRLTRPKRRTVGETETAPWTVGELAKRWVPPKRKRYEND